MWPPDAGGPRRCPVHLSQNAPVRGPLGAKLASPATAPLAESEVHAAHTHFGNALIFAFAGHDTTGHTLSWLLLELAKQLQCVRACARALGLFGVSVSRCLSVAAAWAALGPRALRCASAFGCRGLS